MKQPFILALLIFSISLTTLGCNTNSSSTYHKYEETYFDSFDSLVQLVAYTKSEEEFKQYSAYLHNRFLHFHKLFDIYNDYDNINNVKKINDLAGIEPVKVEPELYNFINYCIQMQKNYNLPTNIAFGPVLRLWHTYREDGLYNPIEAVLPPMTRLKENNMFTNISDLILDEENQTIFLTKKRMSLDVGAVAKGYATEIVAQELQKIGLTSGIINAGGNIRTIGKPMDGIRKLWGVGIQNPDSSLFTDTNKHLDIVYLNDMSVVTSGNYQRYYIVDDTQYHHLIDPISLMPANFFKSVTVISKNASDADFLSTSLFLMPLDQGKLLISKFANTEAVWVTLDGEIQQSEGYKNYLENSK
jgi:thiamine biosynthesis lipoprotein